MATAETESQRLLCGCCGQLKPSSRLTQLGSTPGVHICAKCAVWASFRTRGIALDRLHLRPLLHRLRPHRNAAHEHRGKVLVAIPILPAADLTRTAAYYAQLGFSVTERVDTYLVMSAGPVELHFIDDDPDLGPGFAFVNMPDVDGVWERLQAQGAEGVGPVREQFGLREFLLTDPDRNRVRIGHATAG